jgi:hypothetical protein
MKNIHFLDMPLSSRTSEENPQVRTILHKSDYRKNKTTSGFAAGDLADPHGTRSLPNAIFFFAAMKQSKTGAIYE